MKTSGHAIHILASCRPSELYINSFHPCQPRMMRDSKGEASLIGDLFRGAAHWTRRVFFFIVWGCRIDVLGSFCVELAVRSFLPLDTPSIVLFCRRIFYIWHALSSILAAHSQMPSFPHFADL
ncbi:hypothetical protein BV22DRAFT_901532 [Leucogyrophana mollusca]|uniref:Uncharacterized protein n=1 Tax=Leucogyrophana mollusca TaxID=85980 RepID=A0ACB8AZS9_9AGAM|nr:hypothetical protein BV22DRAFT_901532 [Leucogyrophana mollusca]